MPLRIQDPRVALIVQRFEALSEADLARLGELYTEGARFKDPFNEVQGLAAIRGVYQHMYDTLDEPRFLVREAIVQGDQCFLAWNFVFRMRRWNTSLQTVVGGSHLKLAADGRIEAHRDYWDVAEELYEKLPLLGGLMRWLKRRART